MAGAMIALMEADIAYLAQISAGTYVDGLAAAFGGTAYRLGGDEFCLLAPLAARSATEVAARGAANAPAHADR